MSDLVISVEGLWKQYRLGDIGTGSLSHDIDRWIHKLRGKEDPYLKISDENDRTQKSDSEYVWALKDLNFSINRGEVVGFIGRNGAGKSTLLKILSKVTQPTKGNIRIKGRIASLLEVGTGFHPELTGKENIFLNGAILGMTKAEVKRKFDEIVDFAGVEKYIDTPVKRYSSGMYVRLAFGVAAHLEPEILIVDEVLAVGDAEFQKKALGKMKDVSKGEGRTILFVSHNMAAIASLCSQSVFMQHGKILDMGNTRQIIDEYISFGKQTLGEVEGDNIEYSQKSTQAYFNAIRLLVRGEITTNIAINDEIEVELEYTITSNETLIFPSIHLLDNLGTCIFATFNGHSANTLHDNFFGTKLKKGRYKSTCIIPGNFLNDNTYSISAFLVPENFSDMASVDEALSFTVSETGEMRKEFAGGWAGIIRPKMGWQTKFLNY